ncbi:uncharacterized protein ofcc1 [Brienomyrus brachyistius]|uniref:uncharacterized protein ofcc1 n=1 Tax=Brienomyrus brachyistius TaxID=42636 RepID=UPI0020B2E3D9|nr:uncharacterized protein ofcc1 [Brienomyrus brachyistius]
MERAAAGGTGGPTEGGEGGHPGLGARARGNEFTQNDSGLPMAEGTNPRRPRMEVGTEDELELKLITANERDFFLKMSEILNEDQTTTTIDVPGELQSESGGPAGRQCEAWEREGAPRYVERMEESVQNDMITVGSYAEQKGFSLLRIPSHQEKILPERIRAAFHQAEGHMLTTLQRRKGEVVAEYGRLTAEPAGRGTERGFHWQVEWKETPQPVEIQLRCLRAVRDKLPEGRYAVKSALHSRLGGAPLRWSRLRTHPWPATTQPVLHRGRFHDTELQLDQRIFGVLPSAATVLPSMILQFELLSLSGEQGHAGTVLAWGAFPVCDCSFDTIQGKFRMPLLRGCPSPSLDQYRKIEAVMSADLDGWLCNLYFQVKKLPRGSSAEGLSVSLPIPGGDQESGHEEPPVSPSAPSVCSSASLQGEASSAIPRHAENASDSSVLKGGAGTRYKFPQVYCRKSRHCLACASHDLGHEALDVPFTEQNPEAGAIHVSEQGEGPGLCADALDEYTFSLHARRSCSGRPGPRLALRMLLSELGLSRWRCADLLLVIPPLALISFARLYLHYCSQWLFLQAIAVPVSTFRFHLYTVDLVYQNSLLRTHEELVMVVVGPLTLNAATLLLVLIRWGCQLIFGSSPPFLSNFIMALGVWTVLDPLAVFAVDAVLGRLVYSSGRPLADAAKLAWHFHRTQQSHTAGVLITLFLYAVLLVCSITILYIYFLRLHNDGRLMDVFHRLHSQEGSFFVPQDLEVTNQELSYIVKKAEQWRGFNGERRKVAVYDYVWTDDPSSTDPVGGNVLVGGETSTHVSIYTLHLSSFRELYRQFLRQPDGAIMEVLSDSGCLEPRNGMVICPKQSPAGRGEPHAPCPVRERRKKKAAWRSHRVEPAEGSSTAALRP